MMKINIIKNIYDKFDENQANAIKRILFENSCNRIMINIDMMPYVDKLLDIIGYEYKPKITINNNVIFGEVLIVDKNCFEIPITLVYKDFKEFDVKQLNQEIIMLSPKYLIMNNNTLEILTKFFNDDIDKYMINDSAYYHSYHNVAIGRCEFLPTGTIELVN